MTKKVNTSNLFALVAQQQHRQQKQRVKTRPNRITRRTNSLTTRANCPATRAKCLATRANSYNKSEQSRDWLVHFDITLTFVFLSILLSLNAVIFLSEINEYSLLQALQEKIYYLRRTLTDLTECLKKATTPS